MSVGVDWFVEPISASHPLLYKMETSMLVVLEEQEYTCVLIKEWIIISTYLLLY